MKIVATKKDLVRVIARAASATDRKATTVLRQMVLLRASDHGSVMAYATDLTVSSRDTCSAEVLQAGSVAAPAADLLDRVRAMPDGPVRIETQEGGRLLVAAVSSKLRYQLVSMSAEEYPRTDDCAYSLECTMPGSVLAALLGSVRPVVSVDDTRANLNSVCLEFASDKLVAAGTDGHRLNKNEIPLQTGQWRQVLVPLKAASEIQRLAGEAGEGSVMLCVSEQTVALQHQEAVYESKLLLDAAFPAWRQVIPKVEMARRCVVDVRTMERAIKAVALASDAKSGGVRLRFTPEVVVVSAESPASGDGHDEVPCSYDGPGIEIGVCAKYVLDALSVTGDGDWAYWHGSSNLDPTVWAPANQEPGAGLLGVIMPMRI